MGVKLIFFSLLFDFRYLTGYERKEFKANSCEKKAWKRNSAVDDAVVCYTAVFIVVTRCVTTLKTAV